MFLTKNGKELAPCIVSKVKYTLNVPNRYRGNKKSCSYNYWNDACEIIGKHYKCSSKSIKTAKSKFYTL